MSVASDAAPIGSPIGSPLKKAAVAAAIVFAAIGGVAALQGNPAVEPVLDPVQVSGLSDPIVVNAMAAEARRLDGLIDPVVRNARLASVAAGAGASQPQWLYDPSDPAILPLDVSRIRASQPEGQWLPAPE